MTNMHPMTEKRSLNQDEIQTLGLLIANVAREFPDWTVEKLAAEAAVSGAEVTARFSSSQENLTFLAVQTATRTLLSRTTEIEFRYHISEDEPGEAEIQFGHTGSFSRTGIRAKVKRGGKEAGGCWLTGSRPTSDSMTHSCRSTQNIFIWCSHKTAGRSKPGRSVRPGLPLSSRRPSGIFQWGTTK